MKINHLGEIFSPYFFSALAATLLFTLLSYTTKIFFPNRRLCIDGDPSISSFPYYRLSLTPKAFWRHAAIRLALKGFMIIVSTNLVALAFFESTLLMEVSRRIIFGNTGQISALDLSLDSQKLRECKTRSWTPCFLINKYHICISCCPEIHNAYALQ